MCASSISRKVKNILKETAGSVVELDYPTNYRERSIDYVATLREYSRDRSSWSHQSGGIVVRISPRRSSGISDEVEEDLAKFADAIGGIPLVVDNELYDNIVFDHGRVFATNERTLENLVKERELITLYRRNELYVALNVKLMERELARGGLRLSEISDILGLSRKSVESCLKGLGLVSIDKAERLVTEYGSDVILPIGYSTLREIFKRKGLPRSGLIKEMDTETLVYSFSKTVVDLVVREAPPERSYSLRFYVDFGRTQSVKHVRAKTLNALRLVREFGTTLEVIVPDQASLELVKREVESEVGEESGPYIRFSSQSPARTFRRS